MIDVNSVEIEYDINFNASDIEEIIQNIKTIITTPKGTVPFDRNFGIDFTILDKPIHIVKGLLIAEYAGQIRLYEPRAAIKEVIYDHDGINGALRPKVVIELV